jgi:hypothetical protein
MDRAAEVDAVIGGAPRQISGIRARDQSLGRRAAGVHAGPAEQLSLDNGHGHAGTRQPPGERWTSLAGTEDDGVEAAHRSATTISSAPPIATASSMNAAG